MSNRLGNVITAPVNTSKRWAVNAVSVLGAWLGAYHSTDPRIRLFQKWRPRQATSDQTIALNIYTLIAQCRHLYRTVPMARAVVEGHVADIVGTGIDILPDTGGTAQDRLIQEIFHEWAEHACVDNSSLWEWQRLCVREMSCAGSVLGRWVNLNERLDEGQIPYVILPLEEEWLYQIPVPGKKNIDLYKEDHKFVHGVELDKLRRPVRYHLHNPEYPTWQGEAVDAQYMIHFFERIRTSQTHGEPWLSVVIERLMQDGRLVETELDAAVLTAAPAVAIKSPYHGQTSNYDGVATTNPYEAVDKIEMGATVRLLPGEEVQSIENHRPAQGIAPFRATIKGDIAGCTRSSQYWLDRDTARANYSSMRMDQLLTKRQLAGIKELIGTHAAGAPYLKILPMILTKAGIAIPKSIEARNELKRFQLRPDQPDYVNPLEDIQASVLAIENGLSTVEYECSRRNMDYRHVIEQRISERKMFNDGGLPQPAIRRYGTEQQAASTPTEMVESNKTKVVEGPDEEGKEKANVA